MKIVLIILGIVVGVLALLGIIYLFFARKVLGLNKKLYKHFREDNLMDKKSNALILYQPSRRKTTAKIAKIVTEVCNEKDVGYTLETLSLEPIARQYDLGVVIVPVYFGEFNIHFVKALRQAKVSRWIVIYNGLNKESNKEDSYMQKILKKYKSIKLHTEDIETVREFLSKEIY